MNARHPARTSSRSASMGLVREIAMAAPRAGLDRRNLLFVDSVRLAEAWVAAERQAR